MKRIKYELGPDGKGNWGLKKQGAERNTKNFETKEEGLKFSRPFVREQKNSQLIIKKQNGVIQTEHTYGNDPKKYPG